MFFSTIVPLYVEIHNKAYMIIYVHMIFFILYIILSIIESKNTSSFTCNNAQ